MAITLGGPGAVFWMWAIALVGMATSLVECSLAQVYKQIGHRAPDLDDPDALKSMFECTQDLNQSGLLLAYHDRSDGGLPQSRLSHES